MPSEDPFRIFTKGKTELNKPSFISKGLQKRECQSKVTLGPLPCRYKVLMRNVAAPEDAQGRCAALLQLYDSSHSEWQLGKTKVCLLYTSDAADDWLVV